jgi:protein-tyrosine sulfotransferase
MYPFFLVGVPRSGSTMLRMILDSHPLIFSGSEMPWLGGNYIQDNMSPEVSIRGLYKRMVQSNYSLDKGSSYIRKEDLRKSFQSFLKDIVGVQMQRAGKKIWVEKTPDNIVQVPFLRELLPGAKFIHIIRDGRDVALSTINVQWKMLHFFTERKKSYFRFSGLRQSVNSKILYNLPKFVQENFMRTTLEHSYSNSNGTVFYPIANTYYNALYRWKYWTQAYEQDIKKDKIEQITIKYEDLLLKPIETLSVLFDFMGVDWNKDILLYSKYHHDFIPGDLGSESALQFSSVDPRNVHKWKTKLNASQKKVTRKFFDDYLESKGYEETT